jgi:hypothetical protein
MYGPDTAGGVRGHWDSDDHWWSQVVMVPQGAGISSSQQLVGVSLSCGVTDGGGHSYHWWSLVVTGGHDQG